MKEKKTYDTEQLVLALQRDAVGLCLLDENTDVQHCQDLRREESSSAGATVLTGPDLLQHQPPGQNLSCPKHQWETAEGV